MRALYYIIIEISKTNNNKYKKHAFNPFDAFSKESKWTMKGEGVC